MFPPAVFAERGALCIFVSPQEYLQQDKLRQWRNRGSIIIPGLSQRTILTATDDPDPAKPYRCMSLFEVEDIHLISEETINSIMRTWPESPATFDAALYQVLSFDKRDNLGPRLPGANIVCVGMTPKDNATFAQAYGDFYIEEHLPLLRKVPGWRCGTRYKLVTTFGRETKEHAAPFLAIQQYDEVNGLGGKEWSASVKSQRHSEVLSHFSRAPHRRVWRVEFDDDGLTA